MFRISWGKAAKYTLPIGLIIAGYQGYNLRTKYVGANKLEPPKQLHGIEDWLSNILKTNEDDAKKKEQYDDTKLIDKVTSIITNLKSKLNKENINDTLKIDEIKDSINKYIANILNYQQQQSTSSSTTTTTSHTPSILTGITTSTTTTATTDPTTIPLPTTTTNNNNNNRKRIKLLILGDSLACGVGCDTNEDVPVLVHVIAKTLNIALGVDVEWKIAGWCLYMYLYIVYDGLCTAYVSHVFYLCVIIVVYDMI